MNGSNQVANVTNLDHLAGKFLAFALSKEKYGIEILKVQEIIGVTTITKVPKCPAYIKGVINLRGKIIPVLDLRLRFEIEPIAYDEKTCVIVINGKRGDQKVSIGVIVDTVLEVMNLNASQIEAAPNYGASLDTNIILGMGRKDPENLLILLDIDKVLADPNLDDLAKPEVKAE